MSATNTRFELLTLERLQEIYDILSTAPPGAAVWGTITGTLSAQLDLQAALNAKYNNPIGTISQYIRGDGTLASFPTIPAQYNPSAGTGISITGAYPNQTITNTAPDQTVALTAGTGISTSGTYPNFTITNSAPDQTVSLTAGSGIGVTGTYPNFTITNSSPSSGGTVTSVGVTAGTGISVSGSPITSSGSITVTNSAPDQVVALTAGTGIGITGTYPNFTITNSSPSSGGTVTSVTGTAPIASTGGTTPAISISQATTSTNGYLSSIDWNTFNGKQNALTRYVSTTDGTAVSSTTTITLTSSQLIPANTFSVGNVIRLYVRFSKSTAVANTSFLVYINTSASVSGATQLGVITTNNRTNGMKRDLYIKSATATQMYPTTGSAITDDVVQSNAASSINIDWTTDKYIIFAIGHSGATDTGGLTSGYTIEKY